MQSASLWQGTTTRLSQGFVHYGSPGLFIICACPHINIMGKGIFAWYLQYDSSVNCIEILDVIQ